MVGDITCNKNASNRGVFNRESEYQKGGVKTLYRAVSDRLRCYHSKKCEKRGAALCQTANTSRRGLQQ